MLSIYKNVVVSKLNYIFRVSVLIILLLFCNLLLDSNFQLLMYYTMLYGIKILCIFLLFYYTLCHERTACTYKRLFFNILRPNIPHQACGSVSSAKAHYFYFFGYSFVKWTDGALRYELSRDTEYELLSCCL